MEVIRSLTKTTGKTHIALGYFDSVHRGHAEVIGAAVRAAREDGTVPAVMAFDMSSLRAASKAARDIMTEGDKERALERLGAARYLCPDFRLIAPMSGEEFVRDVLAGLFGAAGLSCGGDFRFGKGRACGTDQLAAICSELGVSLRVVPAVGYAGAPVSSTRIREALGAGDIPSVNAMLGRPYSQTLRVFKDRQLASRLGFPTINQVFPDGLVEPRFGVYHTNAVIGGAVYEAVSNVGRRPTVTHDVDCVVLESHLLDFDGDLYGRDVEVRFLHFLRDERRFGSLDELRATVEGNIADVRRHSSRHAAKGTS